MSNDVSDVADLPRAFIRKFPALAQILDGKQGDDCIIGYITGKYGRPSPRMILYVEVDDARNEDKMSRNEHLSLLLDCVHHPNRRSVQLKLEMHEE